MLQLNAIFALVALVADTIGTVRAEKRQASSTEPTPGYQKPSWM